MAEQTDDKQLSIFVTGATTGIGREVVRDLVAAGYRVTAATDQGTAGAEMVRADGAVPVYTDLSRLSELKSLLQMAKAEVLIHLAPQALNQIPHQSSEAHDVDTLLKVAADNVAEAAGWVGIKKLIYPSMAFVYGDHGGEWVDESADLHGETDLHKAVAYAETAVLEGGVPGYVLRAGYLYGAATDSLRDLAADLQRGRPIPQGNGLANWIHLRDLKNAIMKALEHEVEEGSVAEVFNITDGNPATPEDFLTEFRNGLGLARSGKSSPLAFLTGGDPLQDALLSQSVQVKNERAKSELGWTPEFTTLAAGIAQTLLIWRAEEPATV